jgi:hypothetical protein
VDIMTRKEKKAIINYIGADNWEDFLDSIGLCWTDRLTDDDWSWIAYQTTNIS